MATLPNINNAGPKMPDEDFGKSEREEEKILLFYFRQQSQFTGLEIKILICQYHINYYYKQKIIAHL